MGFKIFGYFRQFSDFRLDSIPFNLCNTRDRNQCDQIWRNFATLVKYSSLTICLRVYLVLSKIWILFWQKIYAFGHISKWLNIAQIRICIAKTLYTSERIVFQRRDEDYYYDLSEHLNDFCDAFSSSMFSGTVDRGQKLDLSLIRNVTPPTRHIFFRFLKYLNRNCSQRLLNQDTKCSAYTFKSITKIG